MTNAAVKPFAVQLQWSVQAVELDEGTCPLAIFSAYTLYTVEGSRDGRKWYGLRLGFFSDANSGQAGRPLRALGVRLRSPWCR